MKKFFLSLSVCSMVLLFSNCSNEKNEIIEIPDANFKAYLLEKFDKNKDGNISTSEANAVKEMNCSGRNIKALDGIEKFKNLKSLDCNNNKLDEVDIRYNKKLEKLICTGNNAPLNIYIGMSSPMMIPNYKKPKNDPPQQSDLIIPVDETKCIYDHNGLTLVMVVFSE